MQEAMNLTYGDLIVIELALTEKFGQLDVSMQVGHFFSELIGKVEYSIQQLRAAADKQVGPGLIDDPTKT